MFMSMLLFSTFIIVAFTNTATLDMNAHFFLKADTDCTTSVGSISMPFPLGTCYWDSSMSHYIQIECQTDGTLLEKCYQDAQCTTQKDCIPGDSTKTYTNGGCMNSFAKAFPNDPDLVPFSLSWLPGQCDATPTKKEEALADSGLYTSFSAIEGIYSAQDMVYFGLAMIGLLSIIRGLYHAYQQSYKPIPSEADALTV